MVCPTCQADMTMVFETQEDDRASHWCKTCGSIHCDKPAAKKSKLYVPTQAAQFKAMVEALERVVAEVHSDDLGQLKPILRQCQAALGTKETP